LVLFLSLPAHADQLQDGEAAFDRRDYQTALKLLQPLADQGNPDAQYWIGLVHTISWYGATRDDAAAMKWFRKSADQSNPDAQREIGNMFGCGCGVKQDYAAAKNWYQKAADQGNAEAQSKLGGMYEAGQGVKKDPAESLKWYRKAADQADAPAQSALSRMYEAGQGVKRDYVEAYYWWALSQKFDVMVDRSLEEEQPKNLTLEQVEAVKRRVAEWTLEWHLKNAEQGHFTSQRELGRMYYQGDGVKQDYVESYFWRSLIAKAAPGNGWWLREASEAGAYLTPEQKAAVDKKVQEWKPTPAPASKP
jgi:uncharacterized protein